MTPSDDLQKLFTAQRQRREQMTTLLGQRYPGRTRSPETTSPRKLFWIVLCTLLIALGFISALTLEFIPVAAEVPPTRAAMLTESPTSTLLVTPEISASPAVLITARVCTGETGGHLHVRLEPGQGAAVRGYLSENEIVRTDGESVEVRGGTWISLLSPIEGWVNARYICKGE
jgi:hypothetical protein